MKNPPDKQKTFPRKTKQKVDESKLTPYQRQRYREQQELDLDENLSFILPDSLEMYEREMLQIDQTKRKSLVETSSITKSSLSNRK